MATSCDKNLRAFRDETLRCGQTDTARATRDESDLTG
jgi:hypothetical protein